MQAGGWVGLTHGVCGDMGYVVMRGLGRAMRGRKKALGIGVGGTEQANALDVDWYKMTDSK